MSDLQEPERTKAGAPAECSISLISALILGLISFLMWVNWDLLVVAN